MSGEVGPFQSESDALDFILKIGYSPGAAQEIKAALIHK